MIATQRHSQIEQMLKVQGAVSAAELTERFGVSLETVRRDLLAMEKAGLLNRVHGGAVPSAQMMPFRSLEQRNREQSAEKVALARNAAALVEEGDYIAMGGGSTALCLAQALKERLQKLTVVTYSLSIFEVLKAVPGFRVILLGGHYLPVDNAFCGEITLQAMDSLHVRKSFVFPSALCLESGIWGYEDALHSVQRKLFTCCDQAYILADSEKFERTALYKIADMDPAYIYVTDPGLPASQRRLYAQNGLTVITESV